MFSFRTTGITEQPDRSLSEGRVGVFCTQSSWDAETGRYLSEVFKERGNLAAVFEPDGDHIPFDPDELRELDAVVVDIQDVGSRFFSFSTDVLRLMCAMCAMGEDSPSLYVVDHVNPAGRDVEGTLPAGESDVWTPKVAHRHGLTLGELANLYRDEIGAGFPLHVISLAASSTSRGLLPWAIPPAPDFPGVFTPYFYTGGSLWTDTSITPGIGTARPYEFIGAPFIKPSAGHLPVPPGILARPASFVPSYGLYEGEKCYGYQFIMLPGARYHSLLHTVRLMRYFSERYSDFAIRDDLYTRLADPVISEYLRGNITFDIVDEHVKGEEQKWIRKAKRYLLYNDAPVRLKSSKE